MSTRTALVLINPSITFRHPLKPALGLVKLIVPTFPGIGNDIARSGVDELPYDRVPLAAAQALFALQDLVRLRLDLVRAPTLVFTSREDHTVDPGDSGIIVEGLTAPTEQVWLERSFHVATLDHDADLIADRTTAWITEWAADTAHDDSGVR